MAQTAKWEGRFNVMGLIDVFDGNFSVGAERHLGKRLSLTTDLAVILYSAYIPENRSALGYNIKPSLRYYTSDARKFFIETTAFYKRVRYNVEDWLSKDCVNDVPAYEQFQRFLFRKQVLGFNLQGGFKKSLSRNKPLFMELYAGIGVRFKWQDIKDDPQACYHGNTRIMDDLTKNYYATASLPHGLRLVYVLQ